MATVNSKDVRHGNIYTFSSVAKTWVNSYYKISLANSMAPTQVNTHNIKTGRCRMLSDYIQRNISIVSL